MLSAYLEKLLSGTVGETQLLVKPQANNNKASNTGKNKKKGKNKSKGKGNQGDAPKVQAKKPIVEEVYEESSDDDTSTVSSSEDESPMSPKSSPTRPIVTESITGSNSSLILEVSQICNVNEEFVLRVVSNLWENNSQYDNIDTVVQAVQETMKHSASSASNVRSSSQPQKSPASNVKEIGVANSEQDDLDQVTAKNQKRKPSQETVKQNVKAPAATGKNTMSLVERLEYVASKSMKDLHESLSALSQWTESSQFQSPTQQQRLDEQAEKLDIFASSRILDILLTTILFDSTNAIQRNREVRAVFTGLLKTMFCFGSTSPTADDCLGSIMSSIDVLVDSLEAELPSSSSGNRASIAEHIASTIKQCFNGISQLDGSDSSSPSSSSVSSSSPFSQLDTVAEKMKELDEQLGEVKKDTSSSSIEKMFTLRELQYERVQLLIHGKKGYNSDDQFSPRGRQLMAVADRVVSSSRPALENLLISSGGGGNGWQTIAPPSEDLRKTQDQVEREGKIKQLTQDRTAHYDRLVHLQSHLKSLQHQLELCEGEMDFLQASVDAADSSLSELNAQVDLHAAPRSVPSSLQSGSVTQLVEAVAKLESSFAKLFTVSSVLDNRSPAPSASPSPDRISCLHSLPGYLDAEEECVGALLDRIEEAEKEKERLNQELQGWKDLSIAKIQKTVEEKLQRLCEDIIEDKEAIVSLQNHMWETIFNVSNMRSSPASGIEVTLKTVLDAQMPKLSSMLSRCAKIDSLCRPSTPDAQTAGSSLFNVSSMSRQQWRQLEGKLPDSLRALLMSLSLFTTPTRSPMANPAAHRGGGNTSALKAAASLAGSAIPAPKEKKTGGNRSNNRSGGGSKSTSGGGSGGGNGRGNNNRRPLKQPTGI